MPNWLQWLLVSLSAITCMTYLTLNQVDTILSEESRTLHHRTQMIDSYINSCVHVVDAMAHTVESTYLNELQTPSNPIALNFIHDYPEYNTFGISGFSDDGGMDLLSSTLTVQGKPSRMDAELRSEIVAALALDSQIGTQTSDKSDFVWAYYTSANRFVMLAPKLKIDDFQFTTDLYKKAYWTHALPAANPELKTQVSPLYEDAGGKGLMVTVTAPVVANDTFLGITSVDIGIQTLSSQLTIGESLGESLLVRTNGNIIARPNTTIQGDVLTLPLSQYKNVPIHFDDKWWIIQRITGQDIVVVQQLEENAVYLAAFYQTSTSLILLLLMIGLVYSQLKLKKALIKITDIAHIDQLSSLLNRRGFRDNVEQIFSLNSRIHAPWVILMLDIDHFKLINDQFGHEAGDKIITTLSTILKHNIRESDLACRWGGEEFVVFFYNANLDDGYKLAEKFRKEISLQVKSPDQKEITVSIGIAEATPDDTIDKVIEKSDRCLYFAKHTGRDRISTNYKY